MDKQTYEQLDRIEAKIDYLITKTITPTTTKKEPEEEKPKKEQKNEPKKNRFSI